MEAEERAEDSGDGLADARVSPESVFGALTEDILDGGDEQIEAADRRNVKSQWDGREGHGEEQLQHLIFIDRPPNLHDEDEDDDSFDGDDSRDGRFLLFLLSFL